MLFDWLVVGAGFTGAVLAERIATQLGQRVLVVDRRSHIGGNAADSLDAHGVLIHTHGPHIFHTNSPRIAEYLSRFTEWTPYEHRVLASIDGVLVPAPFNLTSFERILGRAEGARLAKLLTDEYGVGGSVPILTMRQSKLAEVRRTADFIYEKLFLHYTTKQWGVLPEALDSAVSARVPVRLSYDDRYFQDSFQKMPSAGYTPLFKRMLNHPLITVRLGVVYDEAVDQFRFDRMIFTGPIDEYFGYRHDPLPYRSMSFSYDSRETDKLIQPTATLNYPTPAEQHRFTRTTEFRHMTSQCDVAWSTIAVEVPEPYTPGRNEPHYPIPCEQNREIARKYQADADKLGSVIFAGRLADYNYYNMDQAVARALSVFEKTIAVESVRYRRSTA